MDKLNEILFPFLNASGAPPEAIVAFARFAAEWIIYLAAAAIFAGWVVSDAKQRAVVLDAVLVMGLSLIGNLAISLIWYHPRPFELGVGHQLLAHAPETSFPSDHGTVLFALAVSLLAYGAPRLLALAAMVAALTTAWARVYLGVHWPMDMVGSAVLAVAAVWLWASLRNRDLPKRIRQGILRLNDRVLDLLRLPTGIAPRSFGG